MMITTTGYIPKLTYRLYQERDMQAILELWEKYSGWGKISEEQFRQWYLETPYGQCIVIVATDKENNVSGQIVFIPCVIQQNGKVVKGLKVSSPILNDQARDTNIKSYDHPVFSMFRQGMQVAKMRGYEIVYMFPSKGWTSVLKLFPRYGLPFVHVSLYDCFGISLNTENTPADKNIKIGILQQPISKEFDQLWVEATEQFPLSCGVERSAKWLQWKISGHLVFEARHADTDSLIGYAAVNQNSGLIVDMLARTKEDLGGIIKSVIHCLNFSNPERYPTQIRKLTGMLTPTVQSVLEDIPYEKEDFTFAFGCYSLQDSNSFQSISPSNWYMMPND